jgi:hypothetical protein
MSVAKRITEAIDKLIAGDPESALIPASIAVDATASQVYPAKRNNEAYKDWLHDNLALITKVGMGNVSITENFRLAYNHPELRLGDDGLCSFEQILYHVVRCGLLHGAKLPENLMFSMDGAIRVDSDSGKLTLGSSLIYGLIAAVVVSPVNRDQTIPDNYGITIFSKTKPLNELWGQKQALLSMFDATPAT